MKNTDLFIIQCNTSVLKVGGTKKCLVHGSPGHTDKNPSICWFLGLAIPIYFLLSTKVVTGIRNDITLSGLLAGDFWKKSPSAQFLGLIYSIVTCASQGQPCASLISNMLLEICVKRCLAWECFRSALSALTVQLICLQLSSQPECIKSVWFSQ